LVSLVEQILAPRVLAAPLHRHSREDEYSVVLEGRLGVFQDGEYDPATLPTLAAEYGCEVDFDRTMPLVERHGLVF
jgi:hypothetical protein